MSRCFGNWKSRTSKRSFAVMEPISDSRLKEQMRQRQEHWDDEFKTPAQYIERKLVMLQKEMYIEPTVQEIGHLYELKTRQAIDNAVHSIIDHHWGEE